MNQAALCVTEDPEKADIENMIATTFHSLYLVMLRHESFFLEFVGHPHQNYVGLTLK